MSSIPAADFAVYVDFDSTLFRTRQYSQDLFAAVARHAGCAVDAVINSATKYISDSGLYMYDFGRHMASLGLELPAMWDVAGRLAADPQYLFADSLSFLCDLYRDGYRPEILTFGEQHFQTVKIEACLSSSMPKDIRIPVTVVDYRKHQYIRQLATGSRGVLVDDVANQELPAGFTEIHLDRPAALTSPLRMADGFRISDLIQARQVIDTLRD